MSVSYLAEFRKALKMSKKELAEASRLSESTISKWEEKGIPGKTKAHDLYNYSVALKSSVGVVAHFSELQKEASKYEQA